MAFTECLYTHLGAQKALTSKFRMSLNRVINISHFLCKNFVHFFFTLYKNFNTVYLFIALATDNDQYLVLIPRNIL